MVARRVTRCYLTFDRAGGTPLHRASAQLRVARPGCESAGASVAQGNYLSIQFFFSGTGARSSSSLERNSLRSGEVFALL
jgi:hypothetical protein